MARTKEFDKAEVLEKAKQLFWKQGFHATTVQNLVDHLGINRASIYNTFGGKNELYEAAFKSYREENFNFLKSRLSNSKNIRKDLTTLFKDIVSTSILDEDRKGCFVVNCTTEYLPIHNNILADLNDNQKCFQNLVSEVLQRGIDNGEFDDNMNVKDISSYLFTFLSGLQISSKVKPKKAELFRLVDLAFKAF